jgi:hypothetical protein
MHKTIATEIYNNRIRAAASSPSIRAGAESEVFDPEATLPSMFGRLQLYVDGRGATVVDAISQSKAFNQALESGGAQPRRSTPRTSCAATGSTCDRAPTPGIRCTAGRAATPSASKVPFDTKEEEGFFQLGHAAGLGAEPADKDLYVHEVIARWAGWSRASRSRARRQPLRRSRQGDSADDDDPEYRTDEAITAFKVRATYNVTGSPPRLRFDRAIASAPAPWTSPGTACTSRIRSPTRCRSSWLPRSRGAGLPALRAGGRPLVVIRDEKAVTSPGSAVHRLVMRTFNKGEAKDTLAADLTASDRHIVPPRTSVELAERMGMFDGPDGKLETDAGTRNLAASRDADSSRTPPSRWPARPPTTCRSSPVRQSMRCPICRICARRCDSRPARVEPDLGRPGHRMILGRGRVLYRAHRHQPAPRRPRSSVQYDRRLGSIVGLRVALARWPPRRRIRVHIGIRPGAC